MGKLVSRSEKSGKYENGLFQDVGSWLFRTGIVNLKGKVSKFMLLFRKA